MKNAIVQLFIRDLERLQTEIQLYNDVSNLWKIDKDIQNTAGNLTIHLIGNLNHFIGAVLGNTGYIRQREKEFNDTHVPRKQLMNQIDEVKEMIESTVLKLTDDDLTATYPIHIRKEGMTVDQFLIHLYGHLNYHLGQINYHRRLLDVC